MSVPILSVSLVIPARRSVFGVPPSTAHTCVLPCSSVCMCTQACGLIHSILTTLPRRSTGAFASNSAAKAWCADAVGAVPVTAARRQAEPASAVANICRVIASPRCASALLLLIPRAAKNVAQGMIAFVAGIFVHRPLGRAHGHFAAPGLRVGRRVLDGEFVQDCIRCDACE